MRVCNLQDDLSELGALSTTDFTLPSQRLTPTQLPYDASGVGLNQTTLAMWPAFDLEGVDLDEPYAFAFEQPYLNGVPPEGLPPMQQYM